MQHCHKLFIILCLSGTGLSLPAGAQEVPPAARLLIESFGQQSGIKPTYDSIETAADGSVTISRLSVARPAKDGAPSVSVRIDEIELSGISDEGNGLYEIGDVKISNLIGDVSGGNFAVTLEMPQITAEDWYVKEAGANPTPQDALRRNAAIVRKITADKMIFAAMRQKFTVDSFESTWDGDPATGAGNTVTKVRNISIPAGAIAMLDPTGMLKQLGYSTLSFDIDGNASMEIASDTVGFSFSVTTGGRDMGALTLGMSAAGIPLAVYAEVQDARTSGKEPDFNSLLPKVQGVTLSDFSFRFEDRSITGKLLPMLAAMQGTDAAALSANAGAMVQMGLMQLQNQAFSEQAAAAVNTFLKDPKSLTITVKPAAPLSVSEIMAMNPAQPGEIITRLGLGVTAND